MGMRRTKPIPDRFWAKVSMAGDCWQWTGAILRNGYGYFGITPHQCVLAHRWSYQFMVGDIPTGLELDHLCRNRACVNPDHLEPVSHRVNVARGENQGRPRQTHCAKGHELTPDNVEIRRGGGRRCLTCRRVRDRLAKRERRARAKLA
jgi:HNH endonuclease